MTKEASARIKINTLLEKAGWQFFDTEDKRANISLEARLSKDATITLSQEKINELGEDFQHTKAGFIDFLLLDDKQFPLAVIEAKREEKNPLDGKEQARSYAQKVNVRFIILSNGNLHYFWDLERGNPEIITEFPTQESLIHRTSFTPNNKTLADEVVEADYIARTQNARYDTDPRFINEDTRQAYLYENNLRMLRPYQLQAIHALQRSAQEGNDRYLFEMATGTGKTLTSAAVIKLFLRTGNARRILFLVDRLELEEQAQKSFTQLLQNDYITVTYKYNKDEWKKADIVVSTIQSLAAQNKYKRYFSPTDFDLIISDEAHRSVSGNSRAVFEYFVSYKLGLTATPRDYLKKVDPKELAQNDPRAWERRQLLDTYTTFGCTNGEPTFKYTLNDGVKDNYLLNPVVVDARTEITTDLLSEQGYAVTIANEQGEDEEHIFFQKDFERKFFSTKTNTVFCETFLKHAFRDPLSGEIGKTIVFCVSQSHASKITQILNQMAYQLWPDKYNSDFAVQVTSHIQSAQEATTQFANNNLNGYTKWLENYKSSKTRVCVTVGMMTTGYDCQDIQNLCLMRPVFSPTDFIQIKGRGTRKYTFEYRAGDGTQEQIDKQNFKLFDFFANCEYFEEHFNYDEVLELPKIGTGPQGPLPPEPPTADGEVSISDPDTIKQLDETHIGVEGMKIDRKLFERAEERIVNDTDVKEKVEQGDMAEAERVVRAKYENKPDAYLNLEKIRRAHNLDRRVTWREFIEKAFKIIPGFKTKDEKLNDEVNTFISIYKPDSTQAPYIRNFFKAYAADPTFRAIIDEKKYSDLHIYTGFSIQELREMGDWKEKVPEYIKDYVRLNEYML